MPVNSASGPRKLVRILLVEDNVIDARATIRATEKLRVPNQIVHVTDGDAALEVLRSMQPLPDLLLLDLNLPGKDGHDVLNEMRADEHLRRTPVIVLTTSDDDADVRTAYDQGASAVITKPTTLRGWLDVVVAIESFWFTSVRLPPQ